MIKDIIIPEGWKIVKTEDNTITIKESKKEEEFPLTWEECFHKVNNKEFITIDSKVSKILGVNYKSDISTSSSNYNCLPDGCGNSILSLCQLLICRNAYRKKWEPDQRDGKDDPMYAVICNSGKIMVMSTCRTGYIFTFQSEEIATEFMNNFKKSLELFYKITM